VEGAGEEHQVVVAEHGLGMASVSRCRESKVGSLGESGLFRSDYTVSRALGGLADDEDVRRLP
jgi:hypothetical protein